MARSTLSVVVTILLLSNFGLALWHLIILHSIYPENSTREFFTLVPIVGSVSIFGIVLLQTPFYKIGAWISAALFLVGLMVGSYEHFIGASPNNIFLMKPGGWFVPFVASVMLLVAVELAGILASIRAATMRALVA